MCCISKFVSPPPINILESRLMASFGSMRVTAAHSPGGWMEEAQRAAGQVDGREDEDGRMDGRTNGRTEGETEDPDNGIFNVACDLHSSHTGARMTEL